MKRWSGGVVIALLAVLLFASYAAYTVFIPAAPAPPPSPPPRSSPRRSSAAIPSQEKTTANGVREAAVAWKDLVSSVAAERVAAAAASSGGPPSELPQSCPFSVWGNQTNGVLAIPCGLVQDSGITVVGVPTAAGGFQIELVGSGPPGDDDRPVVLRYRVSFGGGDEGPGISQNSWTAKGEWGAEERCPSLSSRVNLTVDGLLRCGELAGGIPRNSSSSSHGGEAGDKSKGSSSVSMNFPFVEGHAFTATLWAGLQGFHMTVNGQHETSFPYREGLEPWVVSEVRVAGDLDLLSLLANGLPAPEDVDLIADIDKLKAPPIQQSRLLLFVGVFSTGNNFKRRMALRRSWMQYDAVRSGEVAVRFFTGLDKTGQVNLELWKEAQTYGDIQLMPFVDYYSLITLKTIAICIFGTKIVPAKYIMKTDDDAFVRIDEVISSLRKSRRTGLLYGLISFDSNPHRDQESKWFISEEEWPDDSYPPWAHGPGYIISQDIAEFVVNGHQGLSLQMFKLEDVAMGIWIEEFKNAGGEVAYVNDDRFNNAGCEDGYVLAHYQSPRLMLCLWERLRAEPDPKSGPEAEFEPTCCE
ncbi:unnamed protein product [Spirodela intermedia]|uniref:Galectin domain-containing protein n=1 Tax=Spirodela intermedia TaxID=51605 RepID=A0A7I8IA38_SPIIN|nr:unnamed protein product [Spirodela intermedia]CAA6653912.1 unnamed protein product [Spirodela intermedia]